jgi:iron complex transport system ATP-binding protein
MQVLHDLTRQRGKSILVVIHDINQATAWADHIICMKQGKIVSAGTPTQVISSDSLHALYGFKPKTLEIDGRITVLATR